MAEGTYLVKLIKGTATYEIPMKYIAVESFAVTYSTLDLDSYRDANGLLHRNALAHKCAKVEFETPHMYASELDTLLANIKAKYISDIEKSVTVEVYVKELDQYVTQKMYVPDIQTAIFQNSRYGYIYKPTRIAFIAY